MPSALGLVCLYLTLFGQFLGTSPIRPVSMIPWLLNWIIFWIESAEFFWNWILGKAILNRILNESFLGKIQILNWIRLGIVHHYRTLFEKYNLKKQTSDVKGCTKVLCLNVIYVWYMWHMWKYVIYVKICDVICDMSNATMSQYLAEITAILWLPPMVLSQTVVQTNEVAFILILNDFS